MTEKFYKKSLNFQTLNEGSFVLDLLRKEILLSNELADILKTNDKKIYNIKAFFDDFVMNYEYENYLISLNSKLKSSEENIFFENIEIKDKKNIVHNFKLKARIYGNVDNLKLVGEVSENNNFKKDRSILMTVLNTMPDSIIVLRNNLIFFANYSALSLFGYDLAKEIIGKDICLFIESKEFTNTLTKHARDKVFVEHFDEKIIDKAQKKHDVNISVSRIDEDLLMLTVRDISRRKDLEKEKEDSVDTIMKMKSNLRVTQEKLISQEKMAGIGQLATGIVHEIFNPLGFVMSNFATLKTYFNDIKYMIDEINRDAEITKERIEEIEEKCDIDFILDDIGDLFTDVEEGIVRINGIILNLKKFSRQEVDEFIEYDINEGIRSTLIVAKNEYKYIADVVTNLDDIPYTRANASKINQVLLNLIINASHAIKEKNDDERGLIEIKTYSEDKFIVCKIRDTGIGMSSDVYSQIFQPFYTTKPVGVGTGLGLSISYDIIAKQHDGEISVESEKGKGTLFTFKIPIVDFVEE